MTHVSTELFHEAQPKKGWAVVQKRFSVERNTHYESLLTIGSGYVNIRASLPEGLQDDPQNCTFMRTPGNVTLEKFRKTKSKWGAYIPGFMDRHPLLNEEMVNLPFFMGLGLKAGGMPLDMERSRISDFLRWLDLRDGCEHRIFTWHIRKGFKVRVHFAAYAHLELQQLVYQSVSLQALGGSGQIEVSSFIDADVRTNGYDHFSEVKTWAGKSGLCGSSVITHAGHEAVIVSQITGSNRWMSSSSERKASVSTSIVLKPGKEVSLTKLVALATSLETKKPRKEAQSLLKDARGIPASMLYQSHRLLWDKVWRTSNITVRGDEETTLALRFSIFHLVRANPRHSRAAIDAKTNGGDAYWGRIHWDNEIFIAPLFIYCLPRWARPLLEYRHHTLAGAKARAKSLGYPGAMYAWESGSTGQEECPSFQYADHEVHISSDVILGMWHYICATGDSEFLKNCFLESVFEVARYWMARIDRLPGSPFAHILCVMGPDEYSHAANDNAYTNFTAARTLALAGGLYKSLRNNKKYTAVLKRLKVTPQESASWIETAGKIFIPYDASRSLILQAGDFEYKAPVNLERLWPDRSRPFGQFVSQERLYRSRALKQADVLMLMQLYPSEFSRREISAALRYYEPYTTHDSSLSVTTHSMISAWLGKEKKAWDYFRKACRIDLGAGVHNSGEGVHSANAGALWQCVVFGFLGLRPAYLAECLTLEPRLPRRWKGLELTLIWRGVRVDLSLTRNSVVIRTDQRLNVQIFTKKLICQPNRALQVRI